MRTRLDFTAARDVAERDCLKSTNGRVVEAAIVRESR